MIKKLPTLSALLFILVFSVWNKPVMAQACLPTYSFACTSNDFINLVSTTGGTTNVNNPNSGCNGVAPNNHTDFSATQFVTIAPGNTFNFTVQAGSIFGQGFRILIDYSLDGDFLDAGENIWNSGFSSTTAFTGSITVPLSASGITKMRVICAYASVPTGPCPTASFGEVEDYGLVLCTIPPTPTAASPIDACINNTATLTASAASGTLQWFTQPTGGTPIGTGSPFTTPILTQAGPVIFYVQSANGGCTSPRVPVTVNVAAAIAVNLGPDTLACGSAFTLDAGNPGSLYLWSTGAGSQTLTVTQPGTYSVSLVSPLGCLGSDNVVVSFTPNPVFTVADTISCSDTVVLTAPSGYTSYAWSTGDNTQNTAVTANGTYAITVSNANGCTGTDSVQVTLSPAPSVNLGPNVTQCGDTVTLDAGNPGMNYIWSNTTSNQTTAITQVGTNVVSVIVISPAGCYGYDTVTVTINNQPDANLGPDTSICTNSITLDAGNPGSTYLWSGGNNPTSQVNTLGNGTFSVTVTDPSGCSDSDTITVTTNVPPVISAGSNTSICPGQTVNLTATGGVSYVWSDGATTAVNPVSPTTTTTYYVTGTNAAGCTGTDVVTVTVNPSSTAAFTASVVGATAIVNNTSTGAVTYQWNWGDASPTDNSANPSHAYTQNGTYTITLIVTGICGNDTITQTVTITQVGLQDVDLQNTLQVYPNPNGGLFTVQFELSTAKDVHVEVLDVQGRKVAEQRAESVLSYREQVDLSTAESGVYVLRIITTDGVATRRIVLQR